MMPTPQQSNVSITSHGQSTKQSSNGTITKILENFGFIDDTIFFPLSAVKGPNVKVNDKVYYECSYSQNLPFKWNASLVQLVSTGGGGSSGVSVGSGSTGSGAYGGAGGGYGHHPSQIPPHSYQQQQQQQPPPGGYYQQQQQPPPSKMGTGSGYFPGSQQPPPSNPSKAFGPPGSLPPPPLQQQPPLQHPYQPMPKASMPPASQGYPPQVQQAMAAAATLQQYYGSGSGENATGNTNNQGANKPGPGSQGGQPSNFGPPGSLQYTSQPGAAFQSQYGKSAGGPPPVGPAQGGPPPPQSRGPPPPQGMGGNRWNDGPPAGDNRGRGGPGGPPSGPIRDDRRFGGPPPPGPAPIIGNGRKAPSRFDNERPIDYGPPPSDDRFSGPGGDFGRFDGGPPGGPGRDEFGRDIRGGSGTRERERDSRDTRDHRDRGNKNERDKERDRRDRDRDRQPPPPARREDSSARSSKRSISPVNSISSGNSRNVPATNNRSGAGRRFDPVNLPKYSILKNRFTSNDLKARLTSLAHIPSDLKEVVFNIEADFDLQAIPKPLVYSIENVADSKEKTSKSPKKEEKKKETPADAKSAAKTTEDKKETDKVEEVKEKAVEPEAKTEENAVEAKEDAEASAVQPTTTEGTESKEANVTAEQAEETPMEVDKVDNAEKPAEEKQPEHEQKSETASPKETKGEETVAEETNVKKTKETSKASSRHQHDESIPLYAGKNHKFNVKVLMIQLPQIVNIYEKIFGNDFDAINSLGKSKLVHFNRVISMLVAKNANDGYSLIGGKFVRHLDGLLANGEPNLIATAIRVVKEQTGLNLSGCKEWKGFASFVYNKDNEVDPEKATYEVTKVYFPDIWSIINSIYSPLVADDHVDKKKVDVEDEKPSTQTETVKKEEEEEAQPADTTTESKDEASDDDNEDVEDTTQDKARLEEMLATVNDMKVVDLRNELKALGVKHDSKERKEFLIVKLKAHVEKLLANMSSAPSNETTTEGKKEEQEEKETEGEKRKLSDAEENEEDEPSSAKKLKQEETKPEETKEPAVPVTEKQSSPSLSNIVVRGQRLSVLPLGSALNPHRFDQFELIVVAELLRDALILHFGRYIFAASIYNYNLIKTKALVLPSAGGDAVTKSVISKPSLAVNYLHLAFSYFDKSHSGFMMADDLVTLMNIIGLPFSKKVANALAAATGSAASESKVDYRDFVLPPNETFTELATTTTLTPNYPMVVVFGSKQPQQTPASSTTVVGDEELIVERNSIHYNIDHLIRQSVADQKAKVTLNESVAMLTAKNDHLKEIIQELEAKQKKMSAATNRQNDEMCAVKRDRDQLKTKVDQLRRGMEKCVGTFNDLLKQTATSKGATPTVAEKASEPKPEPSAAAVTTANNSKPEGTSDSVSSK